MGKINYDNLLNDEYFDEFKFKSKSNKPIEFTNKFKTKLKNSKDNILGNQKNIFSLSDNNVYTSKRTISNIK
jgi:hypothetical protein